MEKIQSVVRQTMNSLTTSDRALQGASQKTSEISLYTGCLSDRGIAVNLKKLKEAFPRMDPPFFNLLSERLIANGFSDQRLTDAVNSVIDNFEYKELNISDIVKFDKKVKLYTHSEATILVTSGKAAFDDFEKREVNGVTYRILKTDLI